MTFVALLLWQITIAMNDPVLPASGTVRSEFICDGAKVINFDYTNDWRRGKRGSVTRVSVANTEVPGLAAYLTKTAHNRAIESIMIRQCGATPDKVRVVAVVKFSEPESIRDGLEKWHIFKFDTAGLVKQ